MSVVQQALGAIAALTSPSASPVMIQRAIGGIIFDAVLKESHLDTMTVTDHPVEQGAVISDHAFVNPKQVTIEAGVSNSSDAAGGDPGYVDDIYQALLDLQASRQVFDITTTRRQYSNMLVLSLAVVNDQATENALFVTVTCREVILVSTQTTSLTDPTNQSDPASTQGTSNLGTASLTPAPNANTDALSRHGDDLMALYEIALSPKPQAFTINLAGKDYRLTLTYANTVGGGWILDIADSQSNPLVQGIPLVTGADLLEQYAFLGIGGSLVVQTDNDPTSVPTFANLGQTSHLYFVTGAG